MSCRWGKASCCWKEAEERPLWELAVPGKHLSEARSFPEEGQQSRRGPRQQTRAARQKTRVAQQKTRLALQQTRMELQRTRMGQPQKLRTRWRPLRMAEDQHRPQSPKGSGRQLGGNQGGLQMP